MVGLVREKKARCAARETQVPGLSPTSYHGPDVSMDSVGSEASSEVGRELCRLASSSIRPVSTSPEALSA